MRVINISNIRSLHNMKKLLLAALMMVSIFVGVSCSPKVTEPVYGASITSVRNLRIDTFSVIQIDSMVKADKLPKFSKWPSSYFKDGETGQAYQYTTLYDDAAGMIYTVKQLPGTSKYVVQIRKTTKK